MTTRHHAPPPVTPRGSRPGPAPAAVQPRSNPHAPPPTRFGPAGPGGAPAMLKAGGTAGGQGGYRLVMGAYMHRGNDAGKLPPELAGHGFVAVEGPGGSRQAWGFSPRNYGSFDPRQDFGRLASGVPGMVHDDAKAFSMPGVRTRSIPISATQAQAALSKVAEYRSGRYEFSATRRQCSTFVNDVARAAGVSGTTGPSLPRSLYQKL